MSEAKTISLEELQQEVNRLSQLRSAAESQKNKSLAAYSADLNKFNEASESFHSFALQAQQLISKAQQKELEELRSGKLPSIAEVTKPDNV